MWTHLVAKNVLTKFSWRGCSATTAWGWLKKSINIRIGNQKTVSIDFDLDVSKDTQRGLEKQNLRSIFIIRKHSDDA